VPAALTELPTRSQVMARMDSARSGDGPNDLGVLLVVNLDRFSLVNEGLGHDAGDRFLLYAAQQINGATRDNDIVARLGADEFLILCEGVGARSGRIIAERIVTAFQKSVTLGGHELRITVSVGITTVNRDMTPLDAVRQALSATQRAKTNGRNQAAHFDSTGSIQAMHWHDLERALSVALERDQFVLHFQPISCIRDGSLHGVEALVRWNRPDHGLIPPDVFIPVADSAHGIDPAELTLEMTETALIADEALMVATVDALAAAGISLSIDDFGTGYSSLARLRHLPAKQLKVDRSFVAGLTTDKRDAALVAAVIGLAHEFGMTCVAEGVETAEQFDHLRRLGCDFAQGYLLGRPMPAAALEETWDLATAS